MAKKTTVKRLDNGDYKIFQKNEKGEERTLDTVHEIDRMEDREAIGVYLGLVTQAPNKRRAAVSLQCSIMAGALSSLKEYKGKGDKKTGSLSNGLKESFRKAEDKFFDAMLDKDAPGHKEYIGRLPKINERGDSLEKDSEGAPMPIGERHAYFVTQTRKDPSYANSKNLVLQFFAFVGNLPYSEKTGMIVPPEVMRVMVENVKNVTPPDTSWAGQFTQLCRELVTPDNPEKPLSIEDARLPSLVQMARDALNELETRERLAAERARTMAKPGDVIEQTKQAIKDANPARVAGAPSDKVKAAPKEPVAQE